MSAKRIAAYALGGALLALSFTSNDDIACYWQKKLKGKELVKLSDKAYNNQLIGSKDGTVWVTQRTHREGPGPAFSFSASVKTDQKTTLALGEKTFPLTASQASTEYQVFTDKGAMRNEDLKPLFGKNITMRLDIAGQSPITAQFYAPQPLKILSPIPTETDLKSYEVVAKTQIKWVPDPQHKNGIIINVHEMAVPKAGENEIPAGKNSLLLTPDDGSLSVQDLLPYIPRNGNHFQITLNRFGYAIVEANGKNYRFYAATSEAIAYKFVQ